MQRASVRFTPIAREAASSIFSVATWLARVASISSSINSAFVFAII